MIFFTTPTPEIINRKSQKKPFRFAVFKTLVILVHRPVAHTHAGEPTIMEQILHGHFTGQVREQGDTIIRTLVGRGISQRGHPFQNLSESQNLLIPLPAVVTVGDCEIVLTRTRFSVRKYTETTSDGLQHRFGIRHIIIFEHGTLCSHV